jgi:hypothetical protein
MIDLGTEAAQLAQQPTEQRIRGLKRIIPCGTVKTILKKSGLTRRCPRVPSWFMVWFVIGIGLFHSDCYRQIFRWLQPFRRLVSVPGRSTLCEARQRVGVAPFRYLYDKVVTLLGTLTASPSAFYRGMRLMAIDGFILDLFDNSDNERIFGRPKNGHALGAFPQARVLALCELGTHIMWRFLIKPIRRGEITMAPALLRFLQADMLLLWDRGFLSYDMVATVALRQHSHLLAKVKSGLVFQQIRRFPDGSYLSKIYASARHRKRDEGGILVRIIEYTFDDPNRQGSGEKLRLLTTLLDWRQDRAKTLIVLYHERWEEELTIDELKTHQRGQPVLKSATPAGVVQEIYGLLLAHYVVRRLMFEAAVAKGIEPRRLSFTNTLKILRSRLSACPKTARGVKQWYADLLTEIGEEILEERRDRANPRVTKRKVSKWAKKRPQHRRCPQPTKKIRQSIRMLH